MDIGGSFVLLLHNDPDPLPLLYSLSAPTIIRILFLAVHNSSIGHPVQDNRQEPTYNRQEPTDTDKEPQITARNQQITARNHQITARNRDFYFWHTKSDPGDL